MRKDLLDDVAFWDSSGVTWTVRPCPLCQGGSSHVVWEGPGDNHGHQVLRQCGDCRGNVEVVSYPGGITHVSFWHPQGPGG